MPSLNKSFFKTKKKEVITIKNHYVYLITNLINGKKYIGKRTCSCNIEDDDYLGSGLNISRAVNKYGRENFKKEILKTFETADEAFAYEELLTIELNAVESEEYYNIKIGGKGKWIPMFGDKNPMKKEENKKYGKENPFYGKTHSAEAVAKIKAVNRKKENNSFWGNTHSQETKNKISKANKGRLLGIPKTEEQKKKMSVSNKNRKEIIVNNKHYLSLTKAEKETGIERHKLSKMANDKNNNEVRFV